MFAAALSQTMLNKITLQIFRSFRHHSRKDKPEKTNLTKASMMAVKRQLAVHSSSLIGGR